MPFPRVAPRQFARAVLTASAALALLALPGWAQQPTPQPATLAGKVTSPQGAPLSQATVLVQELNLGALTRPDAT
jgi:hypothetical protein